MAAQVGHTINTSDAWQKPAITTVTKEYETG